MIIFSSIEATEENCIIFFSGVRVCVFATQLWARLLASHTKKKFTTHHTSQRDIEPRHARTLVRIYVRYATERTRNIFYRNPEYLWQTKGAKYQVIFW